MLGVHQALEQHVIVYNPLAWNTTTIINVTVTFPAAAVFDDDGQPVPAQVAFVVVVVIVFFNEKTHGNTQQYLSKVC